MIYVAIYFAAISLLAVILTANDKLAAQRHKWRVRESTLLRIASLGGSVAMLLTMLFIRHKNEARQVHGGHPGDLYIANCDGGICVEADITCACSLP